MLSRNSKWFLGTFSLGCTRIKNGASPPFRIFSVVRLLLLFFVFAACNGYLGGPISMPSLPDDLSKLDLELPPAQYEPATAPADVGNEPVVAENLANGEETEQAQPENESVPRRHSRGWFAIPAWAVSLILHVGMLLILAAVSLEPIQEALAVLIVSGASSEPSMLEEFDVESAAAPMAVSSEDMEFVPQVTPSQSFVSEVVSEIPLEMTVATELSQLKMPSMTQQLTPTDILSAQIDSISKSLNSRSSKMKREMLERYGGNPIARRRSH